MTTINTLVLSEHPLRRWRGEFAAGRRSSALPYGIEQLEPLGYELTGQGRASSRLATKLRDVVEHRLGYPVERPLRALPKARRADLVIALLEAQGVVPARLKQRGVPPYSSTPLVLWACWLGDELRGLDATARRERMRPFSDVDLIVYLSQNQREVFLDAGVPEHRLFCQTWGVAAEYFTEGGAERDLDVVAIGQDRGRDYGTLLRAVDGTDIRVTLVCKPENLSGLRVPENVRVLGTVGHAEYRDLLRRAKLVAVPTHELTYPTGSSVALEAASTSGCVIASETTPLRDFLTDGDNAVLVPVGDADAWRRTIEQLLGDDARRAELGARARRSVEARFNTRAMWGELDAVLRERGIVG